MKSSTLPLLLAALVALPVAADQTAAKEFDQRARALGDQISNDDAQLSQHCRELRQRIEQLDWRPQQRQSAREQFNAECRVGFTSDDDAGTPGFGFHLSE